MVLVGPLEFWALIGWSWLVRPAPGCEPTWSGVSLVECGVVLLVQAGSAGGMWLGHARVSRLWLALGQFGHWQPLAVAVA